MDVNLTTMYAYGFFNLSYNRMILKIVLLLIKGERAHDFMKHRPARNRSGDTFEKPGPSRLRSPARIFYGPGRAKCVVSSFNLASNTVK
jgi:hypothetical protein